MRLILALLLAATPAGAAETIEVKLQNGAVATVGLVEKKETARLRLEVPGFEPHLTDILGEEFQEFSSGDKPTLLAAQDLDGDGSAEIFVRTTLPPRSGQFFAFRLSAGKLSPIRFGAEEALEVSHGGDVILRKGAVEFESSAAEKDPVRRTVRFSGQAFAPPSR